MEHRRNNAVDNSFNLGYNAGYYKGKGEVLEKIKTILNDNEYPEYFEDDVIEYLESEGIY